MLNTCAGRGAVNVTVTSDRAMIPCCGPIASASAPEGMSTAITFPWLAFKNEMASAYRPLTGGLNPVPRIASTYKSADNACCTRSLFHSSNDRTTVGGSGSLPYITAASPFNSAGSVSRTTFTGFFLSANSRATTKPSPPLLPLPQITSILSPDCQRRRTCSTTTDPAFSIRVSDGTPNCSLVTRSISRISAAVTIFMGVRLS